ncbi:TPA: baseplate J/gp47 family protein [Escherichia coli]|nr:baseplate J/gp47 family protein [Escherichia coli]ELR0770761.1 baseplate J/gp47 family protein [Escherichia coli]HCP7820067.1 baseplate J/gp47 family protein [Escherichia coli]
MADSEFQRPTLAENISMLRNDLFARLDVSDTLRRMDEDVRAKVYAAALHTVYGYIDYLAMNMLPDLCDESWLARHAAMKRCPRKGATAASGYMRWEGVSDGLKVTAGSVIQRDDLVQYTTTDDATSSGGVLRVPIACSSAGAVGNADDGTALILVTPVNGLPSSGVADTLTGGFDTEELETWRARVIERYYWTPQGGADGDYVVWAKEVPGITRAWTYRHWMGTGTVGVMIASSDLINPIPEESTETAARQHIGPLAPVAGSDLYVFRPVAHTVDFHIRVTPDTPEIRAAITAELRSFLLRDGYPQGELKVSRISEAISGAAPSLTRVHQRADALMRELDPRTTTELINRWERLCGLPDECIPAGTQTLRQRQQRLDAKVNLAGSINENFYLAQLAALGRPDANITRYDKSTFTCSSACTDAVNAPEWRYYWQVNMPAATNTTWMTCGDPCDSALRIWGDTVVECVLNKLCPSHTYVIFKYPE